MCAAGGATDVARPLSLLRGPDDVYVIRGDGGENGHFFGGQKASPVTREFEQYLHTDRSQVGSVDLPSQDGDNSSTGLRLPSPFYLRYPCAHRL